MAKPIYSAIAAIAAVFIFHAAPASADIEVKAGCDGKWVERSGAGFETYKVCERETPTRLSALRMRAHPQRKLTQVKLHKHLATHVISHRT